MSKRRSEGCAAIGRVHRDNASSSSLSSGCGMRRFWFLIDFKDRLVQMLIDLEQTSEKLDRQARPPASRPSYTHANTGPP